MDPYYNYQVYYDLCYRDDNAGGAAVPFNGWGQMQAGLLNRAISLSAAGSVTLPAGTYTVGLCMMNQSGYSIDLASYVSGWVQLTTPVAN